MVHRDAVRRTAGREGKNGCREAMESKQMIIWHAKGAILSDMLCFEWCAGAPEAHVGHVDGGKCVRPHPNCRARGA